MKLSFPNKYLAILLGAPILLTCSYLLLSNHYFPKYEVSATIISNQPILHKITGASLKGVDRSIKQLISADYRNKQENSLLELSTKIALLNSWPLVEGFITENNLKPKLYPSLWNENTKSWNEKSSSFLRRLFSNDASDLTLNENNEYVEKPTEPPTWKAAKKFLKALVINKDDVTGFIRVSLLWHDAYVGADIVNGFIDYANYFISEQEEEDIRYKIAKIEALVKKQSLNSMKNILISELERLKRSLVIGHQEINQAFKVLDPAMPVEKARFRVPIFKMTLLFMLSFIVIYMILRRRIQ